MHGKSNDPNLIPRFDSDMENNLLIIFKAQIVQSREDIMIHKIELMTTSLYKSKYMMTTIWQ